MLDVSFHKIRSSSSGTTSATSDFAIAHDVSASAPTSCAQLQQSNHSCLIQRNCAYQDIRTKKMQLTRVSTPGGSTGFDIVGNCIPVIAVWKRRRMEWRLRWRWSRQRNADISTEPAW
uniref:Uncharacterized protein n=1 Tax=Mesocestoides corti TaxID=53468 RepID=A0A5K3FEY0_MESCO